MLAAFYYTHRWIAWTLLISGTIMVLSRVFAGIHYPGDILVGIIIGLSGSYIIYQLRDKECMTGYLLVYPVKIAAFLKL